MLRVPLALALILLLGASAYALSAVDTNPGELRPTVPPATLRGLRPIQAAQLDPGPRVHPDARLPRPARVSLSGPVLALYGVALDGSVTELDWPHGLDLSDPLPVPPGAVDLEIELAGPLTVEVVTNAGRVARHLDLPTLVVPIDDPGEELETVHLSLDPALAPALATASDAELDALIRDATLAVTD